MSKLLADQIANYDDNGPIEIKEGLNIASGKPLQVAGSAGSNGNVLVSSGTTVSWSNALDNSGNWDDAHGWGNHAAAGYLTSVPAMALDGLSNVDATTGLQNGSILKYNGASWEAAPDLNDNDNTTYVQSAQASGSNVNLRLTGSDATNDDILVSAGTNVTFSSVSVNGFTIDATTSSNLPAGLSFSDPDFTIGSGSAGYSSIIFTQASGTAPQIRNSADPSATGISIWGAYSGGGTMQEDVHLGTSGIPSKFQNLNPKTDSTYDLGTNALRWQKVYADDIDTPSVTTGNNSLVFNTNSNDRWEITSAGHILPRDNETYDIGSAEKKVRHLFLSDNTIYSETGVIKVADHPSGGAAGTAKVLLDIAKLQTAAAASADFEAFKTAIAALTP
tara:strand:- start:164 stop:1333 length:1170 start_codon:yes stop_codon:yes gene_type:complete